MTNVDVDGGPPEVTVTPVTAVAEVTGGGDAETSEVPAHLVIRMKNAMVAAYEKNFEDKVPNKIGADLIISAILTFLFIMLTFGYIAGLMGGCVEFLMADDKTKKEYEAQHVFCPYRCGGNGKLIDAGEVMWSSCLFAGAMAGGYQVYLMLSSGFTDFRSELVCYKTEEKSDSATIVGTFYEDVVSAHFGSVEMQASAILSTKAKFTAKMKVKSGAVKEINMDVEFDSNGKRKVAIPYYEDSTHAQKNSFKEKFNAKLPQPMLDDKPSKQEASKSTEIPQRYVQTPLGIACAISSGSSTPLQTIRIPKGIDFWCTYFIMVLLTILFFYVMGRGFALIGLVLSHLGNECDKAEAKGEHSCDFAWIFSPVPLGFTRPGHYFDLIFFVVTTIGTFIFWWFNWPTHYEFYEDGIVQLNDSLKCLGKWWPRTTKVLLYQDAVSAAQGKDWIDQVCYQVKTHVTYEAEIANNETPKIKAQFKTKELPTYNISLQGDLLQKVATQVKSSAPRLVKDEPDSQK